MMEQYFKSKMGAVHENLDGSLESDCFFPLYSLPKCYDMPKLREGQSGGKTLITPEKCKQFPDKVLFYIFYS